MTIMNIIDANALVCRDCLTVVFLLVILYFYIFLNNNNIPEIIIKSFSLEMQFYERKSKF
jgi:hypothetical protein